MKEHIKYLKERIRWLNKDVFKELEEMETIKILYSKKWAQTKEEALRGWSRPVTVEDKGEYWLIEMEGE